MQQMSACPSRSRSPTEIVDAAAPRVGFCQTISPRLFKQKKCPLLDAAATRARPSEPEKITGAEVAQVGDDPPILRSQRTLPSGFKATTTPSPVETTISALPSPSKSPTAGLTGAPFTWVCQRTFPVKAANAQTVPFSSV